MRTINSEEVVPRVNAALARSMASLSTSCAESDAYRMTAAEVRGTVLAYQHIQELVYQPLSADTRVRFTDFLRWTEEACRAVTGNSAPARWAREMVGPVLAAALGAAVWMREIRTQNGALKIFGLTGDRALTSQAAWKLVQPHLWEPIVSEKALADIRRQAGIRLCLPANPGPVDVLEELTRPRNGGFPVQVGHWLVHHFREHADADTPYAALYRGKLADLMAYSKQGEVAQLTGASVVHGRFSHEEWSALIHGRIPQSRLEVRAGFQVTKQFVVEYWKRWDPDVRGERRLPRNVPEAQRCDVSETLNLARPA